MLIYSRQQVGNGDQRLCGGGGLGPQEVGQSSAKSIQGWDVVMTTVMANPQHFECAPVTFP